MTEHFCVIDFETTSREATEAHVVEWAAVVIKPARSVVEVHGQSRALGVRFVADAAQLETTVAAQPCLAQNTIHNEGHLRNRSSCFLVSNKLFNRLLEAG